MNGVIAKYFEDKGYGFIRGEDGIDYFFHYTALKSTTDQIHLKPGCTLSFVPSRSERGPQGTEISIKTTLNKSLPTERYSFTNGEVWRTKKDSFAGYEILKRANYIIVGSTSSSGESPDDARNDMLAKAADIGANAIICEEYSRGTGRSGNYRYTTHHFSGRPVVIGKANHKGLLKSEISLPDLDGRIRELIENAQQKQIMKYVAFAFIFIAILFIGTIVFDSLLVGFICGSVTLGFLILAIGSSPALRSYRSLE